MDSVEMEQISSIHVVAIPYPGRGHVNSMMNVCRLLASNHGLVITFVVTEEWLGLIGSVAEPLNIRLRSIPNAIPSEKVRGADFPGFIEAVFTKMEALIEQLLDQLDPPAGVILADTFLPWAVEVGNRRNIPVASLWPMSASVFSIFYHFDLLDSDGRFSVDIAEGGDKRIDYIPGISSIRSVDIPGVFQRNHENIRRRLHGAVRFVHKAKCLLLASYQELETHVIDILREKLPLPIYTVGPSIAYMTLHNMPYLRPMGPNDEVEYCNWLDFQPMGSVLYVSLGSYIMVSSAQVDEIAMGLHASGARFLWVARGDASRLQEMCGEFGLVVPWCDQLKVLCHSSVGGFLTHCGWNSTMESIFAGKSMLTFPLAAEQFANSKLIEEDCKMGMRLQTGENVVRREEVARIVRMFMDLEGDESKELRRRAREVQEACKKAIEKGGSSYNNIYSFVRDVGSWTWQEMQVKSR